MKKRTSPIFFALLIPVCVVVVAIFFVLARSGGSGDLQDFPDETFAKNPATLRGNAYSLKCIIDLQLAQSENGRILAVRHWNKPGRVSVYVPPSIAQNFEIGQRYDMAVRVKDNMLYVEDLEKF
ncbi:MAG: hypothetical protein LUD52_00645 [Opitutae bacterium]|nr:hypothetical protein [Opitutae bacterium]